MMYGTFGAGWFLMIMMIGLPILGVILAALVLAGVFQNRQVNPVQTQNQAPMYQSPRAFNPGENQPARYCAHCGAGLQPGWSHCPQCGAPVQS